MLELDSAHTSAALSEWACALRHIRVRFQIIGNARITNVGKSQSCMVSKLRVLWKQTVRRPVKIGAKIEVPLFSASDPNPLNPLVGVTANETVVG